MLVRRNNSQPFLHRLMIDGTFVIRMLYKDLTQDNAGFVYYGYTVVHCGEKHMLMSLSE